jgi:hypothetical protein
MGSLEFGLDHHGMAVAPQFSIQGPTMPLRDQMPGVPCR